jgi:hypothetical protein
MPYGTSFSCSFIILRLISASKTNVMEKTYTSRGAYKISVGRSLKAEAKCVDLDADWTLIIGLNLKEMGQNREVDLSVSLYGPVACFCESGNEYN